MSVPDRNLRLKQVLDITGLGKSKLYELIRDGEFPAPAKFGRASLWSEAKVLAWQNKIHGIETPPAPQFDDLLG